MRHPLTAAIPAILVVLAACSDDSLMGPSGYPTKDAPSTTTSPIGSPASGSPTGGALPNGSTNGGSSTAAGSTTDADGEPTFNANEVPSNLANGGGRSSGPDGVGDSGEAGGSGSTGGAGSNGGNGGSGSTGGAGGSGVSSDVVDLGGSFEVVVPGREVIVGYRTSPVPAAAGGSCGLDEAGQPNGTWIKTTNGTTSTHLLHSHCVIRETTAPTTVLVTVADRANYVQTPSGNLALNLPSNCPAGVFEASCADRFVHFNANGDATRGSGHLTGQGSDGSVWTIDLSQIQHEGNWRSATADGLAPAYRSYTALVATSSAGLSSSAARFAW